MIWLLVGAGGALGSVARHGLNQLIHERNLSSTFPLGIFIVNVVGSAAIGLLAGLVGSSRWTMSLESRAFLIVGVLGGFTTFSTFSFDTFALVRDGHLAQAVWNAAGQVLLSLAAVSIGYRIASTIWRG